MQERSRLVPMCDSSKTLITMLFVLHCARRTSASRRYSPPARPRNRASGRRPARHETASVWLSLRSCEAACSYALHTAPSLGPHMAVRFGLLYGLLQHTQVENDLQQAAPAFVRHQWLPDVVRQNLRADVAAGTTFQCKCICQHHVCGQNTVQSSAAAHCVKAPHMLQSMAGHQDTTPVEVRRGRREQGLSHLLQVRSLHFRLHMAELLRWEGIEQDRPWPSL